MCECGCANTAPDFQFAGPFGLVYSVQFYSGCRECDTPAGVIVQRWTRKSAKEWGVDKLPQLPWQIYDHEQIDPTGDCAIPVSDAGLLSRSLVAFAQEAGDAYDCEGLAEDGIKDLHQPVVSEVFDAWKAGRRQATKVTGY